MIDDTPKPSRAEMENDPCDFCGSSDLRVSNEDGVTPWISCNKCNSSGPPAISARLAWSKWNNRLSKASLASRLRSAIDEASAAGERYQSQPKSIDSLCKYVKEQSAILTRHLDKEWKET